MDENQTLEIDWLAEQVLAVLAKNIPNTGYIAGKRANFVGLNRFQVLLECNFLDKRNRNDLADLLGIDRNALDVTIKTTCQL